MQTRGGNGAARVGHFARFGTPRPLPAAAWARPVSLPAAPGPRWVRAAAAAAAPAVVPRRRPGLLPDPPPARLRFTCDSARAAADLRPPALAVVCGGLPMPACGSGDWLLPERRLPPPPLPPPPVANTARWIPEPSSSVGNREPQKSVTHSGSPVTR